MSTKSINITIDEKLLAKLDVIVASGKYPNRSRSIEEAIADKLKALDEEDTEEWFEGELESWQEKY
jgi:metal-responsive CopG/Arc/MetJ family transcriptional regulator